MAGANQSYAKADQRSVDRQAPKCDEEAVEGDWMLKRLYDIGWSDEKTCRRCNREEGTEKHRLYHCPCWKEVRNQTPEELERRTMGKNLKERSEVARRNHFVPCDGRSMGEKPSDSAKVGI